MGSNWFRTAGHIAGEEGSSPMSGIKDDRRTEIFSIKNVRKFSQRAGVGVMGADLHGFTRVLKTLKRT